MAEDQPSSGAYNQLAYYLYASLDISGGDQAADKAVAEAPKSQRSEIKKQLEQIRKQAVKLKKQQAKAQKNAPPPTTPGRRPAPEPVRRSRNHAVEPPPPAATIPVARAVSSTGRAGDS